MSFIIPALSNDESVRDVFFESLKQKENRVKEPWVGRALQYLHHPLRAESAEKYIIPSLELVREGVLELRQDDTFGPIYLRKPTKGADASTEEVETP